MNVLKSFLSLFQPTPQLMGFPPQAGKPAGCENFEGQVAIKDILKQLG